MLGVIWEKNAPGTECPHIFYAGMGLLQLICIFFFLIYAKNMDADINTYEIGF